MTPAIPSCRSQHNVQWMCEKLPPITGIPRTRGFKFFLLPSRVPRLPNRGPRKLLSGKQTNSNIGIKMEYEIRIYNEEKYVEIVTSGVADKDGSLSMAKTIKETMQQHRMTRALIDHRNIESVSGEIIEIYDRPKLFRIMGVVLNIKIAEDALNQTI